MIYSAQETSSRLSAPAVPFLARPDILEDGALLARWYILYRLDEEIQRAHRYQRPLSLLVATPAPPLGRRPSAAAPRVGAATARATARPTDLLGWLGHGSFLVVMPETTEAEASEVIPRWRAEMWLRTRQVGGVEWRFRVLENPGSLEQAERFIEAATEQLAQKVAS